MPKTKGDQKCGKTYPISVFASNGVSVGTIGNYESGYKPARIEVVEKVIQVERFEKYTMWILHDKTFPAAGQVAPALSLDGSIQSEDDQASIDITQKSPRSGRNVG